MTKGREWLDATSTVRQKPLVNFWLAGKSCPYDHVLSVFLWGSNLLIFTRHVAEIGHGGVMLPKKICMILPPPPTEILKIGNLQTQIKFLTPPRAKSSHRQVLYLGTCLIYTLYSPYPLLKIPQHATRNENSFSFVYKLSQLLFPVQLVAHWVNEFMLWSSLAFEENMIYNRSGEPFWLREPLKTHVLEYISMRAMQYFLTLKVKVVSYTFVRKGVPVKENTYPEPSACEVGWPVHFLTAFISPVLPPGTNLLLGVQWASVQSEHRVGPSTREACALTTMQPRPSNSR